VDTASIIILHICCAVVNQTGLGCGVQHLQAGRWHVVSLVSQTWLAQHEAP